MKVIGRFPDHEAGRRMMQSLDAATLQKRQPWYREELDGFVSGGVITEEQAEQIVPLIGQPIADIMHLETPYDKAERAGIITRQQARTMNDVIFARAHSGTALCSGTASHLYAQGETVLDGETLSTDKRDDNVIKAVGGATVHLKNMTVEKAGDTTDHSEGSFTGLNAAVLAEGGTITVEDSAITSHAIGGNNVFVHGKGSHVTLKNSLLDAYGAASNRCVYVSFGGRLEAENCEMVSRGSISSTVATDTGGGDIYLKHCLVKTLGGHCASLYSTGNIVAEHCICVAPETEALIIVGGNTMKLKDTCVFSGQGQGLKLTAAMEECAGSFVMEGGSLSACEGPVVKAEGAAEVRLRNVSLANPSGTAVELAKGFAPPGMQKKEEPPKQFHLVLEQQTICGTIVSDADHTVSLELREGSEWKGTFAGEAAEIAVSLSADSKWILTGDCTIGTLCNQDESGCNIICGGHRLTVLKQ